MFRMRRLPLALPASLFAAFLALPSGAPAQRGGGSLTAPGNVALSPDGSLLAWTLRSREGATLHLNTATSPDPGKERLIGPNGATNCSNTAPVWSPDSQTLAFTSTCTSKEEEPGQEQVFLWSRASGEVRELTHVKGNLQQVAWAPDGHALAFLFVENATRSAGALDAMKPWNGVIGEDGVEIQRVAVVPVLSASAFNSLPMFRRNGMPVCPEAQLTGGHKTEQLPNESPARFIVIPTCAPATTQEKRALAALPATVSTPAHQVTPANLHVYEFAWAPNSREIAYIAAAPPGENNWWVAQLYTQPLGGQNANTDKPRSILDPEHVAGALHGLQIAVPRWSPDGKRIAFIGGLMSDQGSTGGDIWVISSSGGQPTDVTPGINGTPVWEGWFDDHSLGFVEDRSGHTLFQAWDVNKKAPAAPETDLGEVSVSGGAIKDAVSFSGKTDTAAFAMNGPTHPPEIWLETAGKLVQYSHMNDNAKPTSRTESVEWTDQGFHVQGWITYPANYDPGKKYPLIVTVHGGPSASTGARWGGGQWASLGYFEFQPNPRGSFGQGEAFTAANRKDFGYGDLHDIEAGMDYLEAKLPIDKNREGLTGWSYGGFMSMFAATQTTRFRAIVAGAGISDWLSYYGENSIDQWMTPFFGASVYDDPAVYAKSSAISYIKRVKTPMLIIVGDRDGECPAPQSFEMWHALRDLGVKTQLVIYPNEGHGFRDPAHIRDRQERTVKWFADNMPALGGPTRAQAAEPASTGR